MSAKPIVVIDTQVFLRAAVNVRSLPAKVIFEFSDRYILALSPSIRAEIEDVLNRPRLRAKFLTLTDDMVNRMMRLLDEGQHVQPETVPAVARDPKDDIFLAASVEASASYLVTEDQDLLVLNPYQGISIINTEDFLKILTAADSKDDVSAVPNDAE